MVPPFCSLENPNTLGVQEKRCGPFVPWTSDGPADTTVRRAARSNPSEPLGGRPD